MPDGEGLEEKEKNGKNSYMRAIRAEAMLIIVHKCRTRRSILKLIKNHDGERRTGGFNMFKNVDISKRKEALA